MTTSSALRRLRRSVIVVAAIALLGAVLPSVPAQAAGPAPKLRIQNELSRLCLSPAGGSHTANVQIVQYLCDGMTTRSWEILDSPGGQGRYYFKNIATRQCLSPAGGSTGLNVIVVQFTCDTDQSRYWQFVQVGPRIGIRNVKSGLCLSPAGGETGVNTAIVQFTCDTDPARGWTEFGAYEIASTNSGGLCLTIAGGSTVRNTIAVQYYCDRNPARIWELRTIKPGQPERYIRNVNSEMCLSPAGGATTPGTAIVQYYCDSDPSRAWRLIPTGAYTDKLQNVKSGLCLSAGGLNAIVVQTSCDTDPSRNWSVNLV